MELTDKRNPCYIADTCTLDQKCDNHIRCASHYLEEVEEMAETRHHGLNQSVVQLRAGDLVYSHGIHMLFVCRGQHPIWPQLQAVVWCDNEGHLSIDALSPNQVIGGQVVNRGEPDNVRGQRFRQWYLERNGSR